MCIYAVHYLLYVFFSFGIFIKSVIPFQEDDSDFLDNCANTTAESRGGDVGAVRYCILSFLIFVFFLFFRYLYF